MRFFAFISLLAAIFGADFAHAQSGLCKNGDGAICLKEGREALNQEKDAKKAFKIFEKGCAANNGASCFELGLLFEGGTVTKKDTTRAKELALRGCELKDATSCFVVAHAYEKGNGAFEKSSELSNSFYAKACDLGLENACKTPKALNQSPNNGEIKNESAIKHEQACFKNDFSECNQIGNLYFIGLNVPKDYKIAAQYYKKSCDGGHNYGCRNLGRVYEKGLGIAQNNATALDLYKTACQKNDPAACFDVGRFYEEGIDVPKNNEIAILDYLKGCDMGHAPSCEGLKRMPQDRVKWRTNEEKSLKAYFTARDGCEKNDGNACASLSALYYSGDGTPKDIAKSLEAAKKSCDLKAPTGCANLGFIYLNGKDVQRSNEDAFKYSKLACELGEIKNGCFQLGQAYFHGYGTDISYISAKQQFEKSCKAGDAPSCYYLGRIYDEGLGFLKSKSKAKQYFTNACELNNKYKDSCERAANQRALAN